MIEPDYIVIRGTNSRFDGRWYDRSSRWWTVKAPGDAPAAIVLEPVDEFEFRDDGACAQVWKASK